MSSFVPTYGALVFSFPIFPDPQVHFRLGMIMNGRSLFSLRILPALAASAAFVFGPESRAEDPTRAEINKAKAEINKMMETIKRTGKLPAGASYWRHAELVHHGHKRTTAATPLNVKPGTRPALTTGKGSALTTISGATVGDPPPGFGKGFTWDRADNEILLVLFINVADPLGISIDGVQAGDQVQVVTAAGLASFSEDKGNELATSIIGLVAKGVNIVLGAADAPEVKPLIDAAETFAKDQFKATNAKTMIRDPFGVEPTTGLKSRRNGGLLVCLPEAGGTYYSGDWNHEDRGIQGNGVRTDDQLPTHIPVSHVYFPIQGNPQHNTRIMGQSGQMFVLAWDYKFDDNAGFYKVFVKLTKGNGPPPPPPIPKKGALAKPKPKP